MLPACDQSTSSCEIKLRELEIDSYSKILSVFRARGNLTNERRKLLKQICTFLNISQERHRAEVRRVTGDDLLSTIAERLTGQDWTYDWNEEGKRLVPTPTPFSNYTVNTPFADYIASVASLGKKYVDLYNKRLCDSVPNKDKAKESLDNCEVPSEKWLNEINEVYATAQKEKVRDVSVQTVKKKVIPKKCTYCERRKELRKKKLEAKEKEKLEEEKRMKELAEKNVKGNKPEVGDDNVTLSLPSGKQIFIENALDNQIDDLSVSVIAQEVTVETEPTAGPSYVGNFEEPCLEEPFKNIPIPFLSLATPDFTGLNLDSSKVQSKDFMDPSSIRLCPKKKVKKQNSQSHSSHKYLHGDKYVKKKGGESRKDSYSKDSLSGSSQVKYSKSSLSQLSSSRHLHSKHQNIKHTEGLRQYDSPKHPHEGLRHVSEKHKHSREGYKHSHETHRLINEANIHHHENLQPSQESLKHRHEVSTLLSHQTPEHSSRHQVEFLRHNELPKHQDNSKLRETFPKHREVVSKQHEVLLKHHEGMSKYPEVVPKRIDSSSKQSGGIYKHYVRVRHTPKAPVPYTEITKHHTEVQSSKTFGESLEISTNYLQTDRPSDSFESQMEVVDINDIRLTAASLHPGLSTMQRDNEVTFESLERALNEKAVSSLNFLTSEAPGSLVEEILAPSSESSSVSSLEGRHVVHREESSTKKTNKVYNGESKAHGSLHFRADHLKDLLHKFPNTQISHVEVNNGCQMEDNAEILQSHNIWDGALSSNEFIMENVSIVDEGSFAIANGHEEIILEEEVLTGSQIIETLVKDSNISSLVEKSEVCVIPQTDMKFSVVDLTDYSGSMENICSVSSQSKDDSRDSDIVMNRP